MPRTPTPAESLAQQLLDAQVAYHLERLSGDRCGETVAALVEDLLAAGDRHPLADLIDRQAIKGIGVRALATVPARSAISGIVEPATPTV